MQKVALGRTELSATVMGLGGGGDSRLGRAGGERDAASVGLVRAALDQGINFIDTAEAYGTETVIGEALASVPRESVSEGASSLPDAAYRFCRDEPGAHVVLSGTASVEHLLENVQSLARPALPARDRARLIEIFSGVNDVSGH